MGKKYEVESDFDDLHGNPADPIDLEVDLSDSDNPIIQAAFNDSEDYQPPADDEEKDDAKKDDEDEEFVESDDDDGLEEMDDDTGDDDTDSDEDEQDDEDEDDEDADEDDDEKYSKNVRKRIDRERDLRQADKADSDQRIAKLERENKLFRAQSKFKEEQTEADSKLRKLRKQKTEAIDEGNTESQVDIDDQILDIKADRKAKSIELQQLEEGIDDDDTDTGAGSPPAAGKRWLEKYPQFHTNQKFQRTVLQADKMVAGRGFDKNVDKYYEEMEKILAPQFPEIVKLAKKTTRKDARRKSAKKKRSAVGSTTKAGTRRGKNRRGVIRLTKQDQEQMEIFGMDPKNPRDIKAWADSKGS